jgi:hypothetical protein
MLHSTDDEVVVDRRAPNKSPASCNKMDAAGCAELVNRRLVLHPRRYARLGRRPPSQLRA